MPAALASLRIVADDLSGAADCAAAFVPCWGPIPVLLRDAAQTLPCTAIDTDSRSMDRATAQACVARAFERIGGGDLARSLVYKKIDSTLRGHLGAELAAALAAAPGFRAAVVAPSFPQQGRTLVGGRLRLHGNLVGEEGDLMALLAAAGLRPALLSQPLAPAQIAQAVEAAVAAGARAVVVDAANGGDLARLAQALADPGTASLLRVGSAGFARALVRQALISNPSNTAKQAESPATGPVLALVGSFSPASAAQVRQVEAAACAQVMRLQVGQWLGEAGEAERCHAIESAEAALAHGRNVLLAIAGEVTQPFSRDLVQAMARAAAPLLSHAAVCVLTGGDTARALFDRIDAHRLDVTGEFEPGISLARASGRAMPWFVLKAGGFGDSQALQRIIRHFGASRHPVNARHAAPP